MPDFTAGPWAIRHEQFVEYGTKDDRRLVAGVYQTPRVTGLFPGDVENDPEQKANANLINASPDMFEALENAVVDPSKPLRAWQLKLIEEALAKARGEKNA